jgi:glyoxylase-like metal-dependent hydrolase (beta-lactamase superfamily II)
VAEAPAPRSVRLYVRLVLGVLVALLGWLVWQGRAIERPGPNQPVIAQTPWGQQVAPTIDTLADIAVWQSLRPGQRWSAGAARGKAVRGDYAAGRIRLSRTPWRIAEGVWAIGPWNTEQQIYLIDTGAGLVLVDPSLDAYQDEVLAQIRGLGFAPEQVKWVVLSHCHIDHGQSCRQWQARGAKVLIGAGDADAMAQCSDLLAIGFVPEAKGRCTPCNADIRVADGQVLRLGNLVLHAIGSPGHTPGSTSFAFQRQGRWHLLSGDIALHNGRHAWMGGSKADWGQYLASLAKLTRFAVDGRPVKFDVLLPGHGTIDLDQGQRSIEQTERIVASIVARRAKGEDVGWVEAYRWGWEERQRAITPPASPATPPAT